MCTYEYGHRDSEWITYMRTCVTPKLLIQAVLCREKGIWCCRFVLSCWFSHSSIHNIRELSLK